MGTDMQHAWAWTTAEWKGSDTRGPLYDSIYVKCSQEAKPQTLEADWRLPAGGGAVQ